MRNILNNITLKTSCCCRSCTAQYAQGIITVLPSMLRACTITWE